MYLGRGKTLRSTRSGRRRRESEEEAISIDLSRPAAINVVDFLWRCRQRDGCRSRGQKLAYLNALVRLLCERKHALLDADQTVEDKWRLPLSPEELMLCLRSLLLSDTRQIRAAGYRAVRAAIGCADDVQNALMCHIDMLMVRSLELSLIASDGWQMEKLQVLRLARHMLDVAPHLFPNSVVCCLLALVDPADQNISGSRERLWMLSVATLCQLCVVAPERLIQCRGAHVLLHAALVCQQPRVVDAVIVSLLRLSDSQLERNNDKQDCIGGAVNFNILLNFFTEQCHLSRKNSDSYSSFESMSAFSLGSSRPAELAIVSLLRCWSGLGRILSDHNSPLSDMLHVLRSAKMEVCQPVMRILYDLLDCATLPDLETLTADDLLRKLCDRSEKFTLPDSCELYENFVAEEANLFLPHLALTGTSTLYSSFSNHTSYASDCNSRANLTNNYMAFLLYLLLDAGILDALAEMSLKCASNSKEVDPHGIMPIPSSATVQTHSLCVAGVVLMVELLHRASSLLPSLPCALKWHSLPQLLSGLLDDSPAVTRVLDLLRFVHLNIQKRGCISNLVNSNCSLFFEQQINFMICDASSQLDNVEKTCVGSPLKSTPLTSVTLSLECSVCECVSASRILLSDDVKDWQWAHLHQLVSVLSSERPRHSPVTIHSSSLRTGESDCSAGFSQLCAALSRLCLYARPSSRQLVCRSVLSSTSQQHERDTHQQIRVLNAALVYLASVDLSVCTDCCQLLDQFIGDLAKFLRVLDSLSPSTANDLPSSVELEARCGSGDDFCSTSLSANSLNTSCARYYFLLVGSLLATPSAVWLLERHGVRAALINLVHVSGRVDLVKLIISSLNYGLNESEDNGGGEVEVCSEDLRRWPWLLLEQCLRSDCESKRLYSTKHLLLLVRCRCVNFTRWGVDLLLTQLNDPSARVVAAAVAITHEMCEHFAYLAALVQQQPSVFSLGDAGVQLLARIAGCEAGFRQLNEGGLLNRELQRWSDQFSRRYVLIVEMLLGDSLSRHQSVSGVLTSTNNLGDCQDLAAEYGRRTSERSRLRPAILPPHLYGELARHTAGLEKLISSSKLLQMVREILSAASTKKQELNSCPEDYIRSLKTALWAVGNVACTPVGSSWLFSNKLESSINLSANKDSGDCNDLVLATVRLASDFDKPYEFRATCYLVLGLFGSSQAGAERLSTHGWLMATNFSPNAAMPVSRNHSCSDQIAVPASATRLSPQPPHSEGKAVHPSDMKSPVNISDCIYSRVLLGHRRSFSQLSDTGSAVSFADTSQLNVDTGRNARTLTCRSNDSHYQKRRLSFTSPFGALKTRFSRGTRRPFAKRTSPKLSGAREVLARTLPTSLLRRRHSASNAPLWQMVDLLNSHTGTSTTSPTVATMMKKDSYFETASHRENENKDDSCCEDIATPAPGCSLSPKSASSAKPVAHHLRGITSGDECGSNFPNLIRVAVPLNLSVLRLHSSFCNPSIASCRLCQRNSSTPPKYSESQDEVQCGCRNVTTKSNQSADTERVVTGPDNVEDDDECNDEDDGDGEDDQATNMFVFHSRSRCLRCFTLRPSAPNPLQSTALGNRCRSITDSSTESSQHQQQPADQPGAAGESSVSSADSCSCSCSWHDGHVTCDAAGHVRRQLLRLISSLSARITARAAEHGLLNLKQRYWRHLRGDVCLYSEAQYMLAEGRLCFAARRFVQELFEDLILDDVCSESSTLLQNCRLAQTIES